MAARARWIRLGLLDSLELHASCAGIAAVTPASGAPALVWAQAKTQPCLGQTRYVYAVIAPRRLVPGRAARWCAWALSPAVATYREFGLRAYLNGGDVWLHGRRIAGSSVAAIGECAVVASSFLRGFSAERVLEAAFRARMEAQHGWQFDSSWPSPHERAAIEEARADSFASLVW
jgi:hypothetical protein